MTIRYESGMRFQSSTVLSTARTLASMHLGLPAEKPQFRRALRSILAPALSLRDNGDGFPAYVAAAARKKIDVNDWIEQELGWIPALPVLEDLVFPLLRSESVVCEVGVGTGRWSRHIVTRIPDGRLVLVDRSDWIIGYLRAHFRSFSNISAIRCDGGAVLPFRESGWADLFFSQGLFITMKLGHIAEYLSEFSRCLSPGGHAVFDFIDPGTPSGWEFLKRQSRGSYDVFAYHAYEHVARCCEEASLTVARRVDIGKSTYIVAQKT